MYLSQIKIHSVRNLNETTLSFNPHLNVFYGANGSGKTSLLESIYVLATGKSFRTYHSAEIIQFKSDTFVISGIVTAKAQDNGDLDCHSTPHHLRLGLERKRNGALRIHVNDQSCHSIAELAKQLPVQLMNTDSYYLLEASPEQRRQFLDWGVFHVEHSFFQTWQRYKRALQQRNAALKQVKERGVDAVLIWNSEIIEMGERLTEIRKDYLKQWTPAFLEFLQKLLKVSRVELRFRVGWDEDQSLSEALTGSLLRDRLLGYTTAGPHRADFSFWIDGVPAKTVLSRGQLKLFIGAMFLAHSDILYKSTGNRGMFLMDDLCSELDKKASQSFLQALGALEGGGQVIITAIDKDLVEGLLERKERQLFHVEHGIIVPEERMCTV